MPDLSPGIQSFYGKILLFGEYTILLGGNALAIPLQNNSLNGVLQLDEYAPKNPMWKEWLEYLLKISDTHFKMCGFDWNRFKQDINQGLKFESTLPIGYGLGSSGALTAAVFKRYISADQLSELFADLKKLQKILAHFESFFHGNSSGLDPLVSLLNSPIRITGPNSSLQIKISPENYKSWFLLDSGIPRHTSLLVETFRKKIATDQIFEKNIQLLKTANNKAIENFLVQKNDQVKEELGNISNIQYTHMDWLIPDNIKSIWEQGLETNRFYLKLCGAGGGGFFLAFIPEVEDQIQLNSSISIMNLKSSFVNEEQDNQN